MLEGCGLNAFDGLCELASPSSSRKEKRKSSDIGREIAKRGRHCGIGKVPVISCSHVEKSFCQAALLSLDDIQMNFDNFYSTSVKSEQDAHLLRLMRIDKTKRVRVQDEEKRLKARTHTAVYTIKKKNSPESLTVCKQTFMSIFGVSKDRLSRIGSYYLKHNEARPERRGGCRQQERNREWRESIRNHISQFICRASHYSRKDQASRKYLPSDLSVTKMHQLFREQNHAQISYALYYSVFKYDFNLGFGHPSSDICASCVSFRNKLKDLSATVEEKTTTAAEFVLHRRRARAYYDLMNDVENSVTICFDIMESLVLPKSPIGQTYYSRQLYIYVLGIVWHHGRYSHKSKDENVNLYVWAEWQNRKDSNMVSSALMDCLSKMSDKLMQTTKLRLFSDACPGQNRNITVLGMLFHLSKQFPHLQISHFFPVRGHSFLPADRVFGRIDQALKRHDTILKPNDYYAILEKHGKLRIYDRDWHAQDFKSAVSSVIKKTKDFKISEAKVLTIQPGSDKVGLKTVYSGEGCLHSLLKKGRKWANLALTELPNLSTVSEAKKSDVTKLLDAISVDEETRQFYEGVLAVTGEDEDEND